MAQTEYPLTPSAPPSTPEGYVAPSGAQASESSAKTANQISVFRNNFLEMLLRKVVEAVNGVFVYGIGGAFDQLKDWATDLGEAAWGALNQIGKLINKVGGAVIEDVGEAINNTYLTLSGLMDKLLHSAGEVIGNIPQTLVSGLTGAIAAINNAIGAARNFVQNVIDAILSGLRGIPIIGGLIPDLQKQVKANKADQQNFTISAIVSDARNPEWVCRYPISDVTYPEFYNNHLTVFGTTDDASTGTSHTHTLSATNSAHAEPAGWSVNQNESRGSYITVANTTVHDTVGVAVFKDSGSLNNVYLEVFKENSDTSLTRVFSQEFSSSITTTVDYYEFTLTSRLIVQSGERFLVRVRNSSSTSTIVRVVGMDRIASSPDNGFKTVGSSLTAQTSYTAAQATTARAAGTTLNWFMLAAKFMPSVDRSFSDDANRSAIGGLWVRQSSTASLLDIYEEAFGYTGTSDGDQSALYIHRTTRDVNRVEANLFINKNSTARCGVLLHCTRDFSQVVYLGVNGTSAKIYSGPIDSLLERASLSLGGEGKWALYYDQAADKYVALKDGATIGLEWTSVGSAVTHGADYRFGGMRISLASGEPAGTIDDWTLRDWYIAVPAVVAPERMEATVSMLDPSITSAAAITPPRMESTAAMPAPDLVVGISQDVPRMESSASMGNADVSNNTSFPYSFPFPLV